MLLHSCEHVNYLSLAVSPPPAASFLFFLSRFKFKIIRSFLLPPLLLLFYLCTSNYLWNRTLTFIMWRLWTYIHDARVMMRHRQSEEFSFSFYSLLSFVVNVRREKIKSFAHDETPKRWPWAKGSKFCESNTFAAMTLDGSEYACALSSSSSSLSQPVEREGSHSHSTCQLPEKIERQQLRYSVCVVSLPLLSDSPRIFVSLWVCISLSLSLSFCPANWVLTLCDYCNCWPRRVSFACDLLQCICLSIAIFIICSLSPSPHRLCLHHPTEASISVRKTRLLSGMW